MSIHHDNSFLPSGAIAMPSCEISHLLASTSSNNHCPIFQHRPLMSPPETRSGSAYDSDATLAENWCEFVQRLRYQFQGERAHLQADRDRMQEVIEGERELWDRERQIWNSERKALKTRILDLESKLSSVTNRACDITKTSPIPAGASPVTGQENWAASMSPQIPQESGRNDDGSPFYAPVSHNPTRTFDTTHNLRVDDLSTHRETAIRVTSKKLTSSDFVQQVSPSLTAASVPETIAEAIDISHIQPELDSVAIRISAVSPTLAAKVLSSRGSPYSTDSKSGSLQNVKIRRNPKAAEDICGPLLVAEPENKRLTLFAGHTPSHSLFKFDCLESESVTPGHTQRDGGDNLARESAEVSHGHELKDRRFDQNEIVDGDKELSEPLGLLNESETDDIFLARLTQKLTVEAQKSQNSLSASDSIASPKDSPNSPLLSNEPAKNELEAPVLRIKASMNFGRPFGYV